MSKARARHKARGVDNRKFAANLAAKKELNIRKQAAANAANLAKLEELGYHRMKGETPSRALRRARREIAELRSNKFLKSLAKNQAEAQIFDEANS